MDGTTEKPEKPAAREAAPAEADGTETEAGEVEDLALPETEEAQPEEAGEAEEGGDQEGEQLVTVRVNGKEEQLPLTEVVAGYQRQADYTQKTQAVAAEKREVEQVKAALFQAREQELATLQQVLEELQARFPVQNEWAEIAQLEHVDPGEYARRRIQLQDREAARTRAAAIAAQLDAQKRDAELPMEMERLYVKVPEWKDEKVRGEEARGVSEFLAREGFAPKELSEITDHRYLAIARKAWLYEKLTSSRAGLLQKKVREAPKMLRPGVKADPGQASIENRASLRAKLSRTGRPQDAVALLESIL